MFDSEVTLAPCDMQFGERLAVNARQLARLARVSVGDAKKYIFVEAYLNAEAQKSDADAVDEEIAVASYAEYRHAKLLEPVVDDFLPMLEQDLAATADKLKRKKKKK